MEHALPGSILTLNAGSSSLKFALYDDLLRPLFRGVIEDIQGQPRLRSRGGDGAKIEDHQWDGGCDFATVLHDLLGTLDKHGGGEVASVGHRLVHGGADHIGPERISPLLLTQLDALTSLDPIHLPHSLATVRAIAATRSGLPQVACFDTAFHHTMPPEAYAVGVPRELRDQGVRRYGFHGLSYEYIAGRLRTQAPEIADKRVIIAHLGAGASLCALKGGVSIATTMGFSALDGLMMASRCGSIDPGVILYLARQGRSVQQIEDMLYNQSGLLGVSGISGDMRVLLASENPRAAEAISLFTYRAALEVGAMVSAMGGIDGLVFTAGIGEHAPPVRAAICIRLAWLGISLDKAANAANCALISDAESRIPVLMLATDEEVVIARHTNAIINDRSNDR
jgi:acetate kinase